MIISSRNTRHILVVQLELFWGLLAIMYGLWNLKFPHLGLNLFPLQWNNAESEPLNQQEDSRAVFIWEQPTLELAVGLE